MEEYYILREGDKEGPFSLEDLNKSPLYHSTMLWKKGEEKWRPASHFEELRGIYTPDLPKRKSNNLTTILIAALIFMILLLTGVIFAAVYYTENNKPPAEPQKTIQDYQLEKEEKEKNEKLQQEREKERIEKEQKEREERERLIAEKKRVDAIKAIDTLISVEHEHVESYFLGGFPPYNITVYNNTDYSIDDVIVRVHYITLGSERGSDMIVFENIEPHKKRTERAIGSARGYEISCKIEHVISSELNLNKRLGN